MKNKLIQNNCGYNLDILYDYLTIRANNEKVKFKLKYDFFEDLFKKGTRNFFGVEINNLGFPIWDNNEPEKGFLNNFISWVFITKMS